MLSNFHRNIVTTIKLETVRHNVDNISRTKAYQNIYIKHKEIKWAFLASMVSRNAGWNMTDLQQEPFKTFLSRQAKEDLFSTYERANWLIFSDAYPQLLLYERSKQLDEPLFQLLTHLHVSKFMQKEWFFFWKHKDYNRLVKALIINEQNVIQQPVILQPFFKKKVFHGYHYLIQDFFHMSAVLFPTVQGKVYGSYVHDFSNITKRITLGKRLASLLFHPEYYPDFYTFANRTEPIGSRYEYEQYFTTPTARTPMLRALYPIITHKDKVRKDWYVSGSCVKKRWWKSIHPVFSQDVSHRYYAKRHGLLAIQNMVSAYQESKVDKKP
ncbi:DUF2515 family protein [Pontibacillus yanchengensis]|uniref:DUF2515 domain-containing protein n=1 Tax=Pontibacillus yanchengensis Y32 TaxID=1385514 RepID=A0A0A2TF34_9BACI|nr:DUF2515 family protein [Pontibacillus yanchengensis]KGP73043.1 hypothetical protein N782_07995 [Pontibacillus yanchengensis Y32]